ncbi:MAG TPA: hypothetical protein VFC44_22690 [Candidatus Saccharimonadales bacterium]|nr:hypothetical protein [Candidatus Saccharimonadales bacterium]
MNDFVNYKKRSVALPPGCENLLDVLQSLEEQKAQQQVLARLRAATMDDKSVTGRLLEIGKYVGLVFESGAIIFTLTITPPDEQLTLTVYRLESGSVQAYIMFQMDSRYEVAVWDFLARRGLKAPEHSALPATFYPGVPVQITCDIVPMPNCASILSELIADLFRNVCEGTEDTALHFTYSEVFAHP